MFLQLRQCEVSLLSAKVVVGGRIWPGPECLCLAETTWLARSLVGTKTLHAAPIPHLKMSVSLNPSSSLGFKSNDLDL